VARYLIDRGVPPNRLVAAGFGEFQPLQAGDTDEDLARNRRIELKLTERSLRLRPAPRAAGEP
jgi:chemotaxis protein MotB